MQHIQICNPYSFTKLWTSTFLKTIAGSLFIALCAQISIPLPFTPVPLTGQTLAILFLGTTLGSRQAVASTFLYLFQCIIGLPVLAGGSVNPLVFIGPTAGYLFSMPLLAYLAGKASPQKSLFYNFAILQFASILFLFLGTLRFAYMMDWSVAFFLGFFPFLAGDTLKVLIITFYLTKQKRFE